MEQPQSQAPLRRVYKIELRPTPTQARMLGRCCGAARFTYNWALRQGEAHYKDTGKSLHYTVLSRQLGPTGGTLR
jgi:transposase